jgi:hypothetical protein
VIGDFISGDEAKKLAFTVNVVFYPQTDDFTVRFTNRERGKNKMILAH